MGSPSWLSDADAESRGGIESVDFLRKIREYREAHGLAAAPAPWAGGDVWGEAGRIRVCVRKRPMLPVETLKHDFDVVRGEATATELVVLEPKTKVDLTKQIEAHRFTFDACFNENDGNEGGNAGDGDDEDDVGVDYGDDAGD